MSAAKGGFDMQLDRNQLNRLLRLNDDQLRAVLGKLLAEYGLDASMFPIASMDMSRLRAVLQSATDEDIARFMSRYGYVPAITGGIILAGILASTMSTADSQLLAAASSVSQNLIVEAFKVKMSAKTNMIIARVTVVVVSVVAIFLAADPNSSVFGIVSFAWAGFGAAFGPVILCALFWKRANKQGAIAGMLAGGITIFIWKFVVRKLCAGTVLDIYELLPAFIVGLIVIVAVSLLTPAPSMEIIDTYDEVKENCKGF